MGPQRHPCCPFGLGIFPSRASQYKSTGSSSTPSHGLLPADFWSLDPFASEDDAAAAADEAVEVEAVGSAESETGTILPERVAA